MKKAKLKFEDGVLTQIVEMGQARDPKGQTPRIEAAEWMNKNGWQHTTYEDAFSLYRKPENDEDRLVIALENHDWYYEMSDDGNVWKRGQAQEKEICRLVKLVGDSRAREISKPIFDGFDYKSIEHFIQRNKNPLFD
jgi:hypothetical protein